MQNPQISAKDKTRTYSQDQVYPVAQNQGELETQKNLNFLFAQSRLEG